MNYSALEDIKVYSNLETSKKINPFHDFGHLERVNRNADLIVEILGLKNDLDINLLHAACYLHDIPVNVSKKYFLGDLGKHIFEKEIIKKYLPNILDNFSLTQHDKNVLYKIIFNHPFSIPYRHLNKDRGIYTKILQDADSLDYFSFERQNNLKIIGSTSLLYSVLSKLTGLYFLIGRKIIRLFLNFPNIASINYN